MEPSDLILLVVMGDLIQNGVTQSDYSVTGVVLATTTFGLLAVLTSYTVFRSSRAKKIIEGEPLILVQNGETIDRNLNGERLTLDDVMEEARAQQLDSLDQIKWAVLESNGSISIIPKQ
jgi:uncharacterized membrane protein YcaP (DUF421 family)